MRNTAKIYLDRLRALHARRRSLAAVLVCLSIVVTGLTAWALHIDGESRSAVTYCGLEEHQHSEACVGEKTLICGLEETDGHVHTDECYEITYICGYDYEHTHTLSCYSDPEADGEETDSDAEPTDAGAYAERASTYAEEEYFLSWVTGIDTTTLDGKSFVITSYSGVYAMTTTDNNNGLTGETPTTGSVIWTFEAVDANQSTYRIKTGENTYLWAYSQTTGNGPQATTTLHLTTTTGTTNATTFTVSTPSGDTSHILLAPNTIANYYVNAYGGEGNFSQFYLYNGTDEGSQLRLYELREPGAYDLDSMTLWLHTAEYDTNVTDSKTIHYNTTVVKSYDGADGHDPTITDAKVYYDTDGSTAYLIPVSYLEGAFDFTFDSAKADAYPIVYVPNAYSADSKSSKGAVTPTYVPLTNEDGKETWYIQVTDTTGAATPRSNIYWVNATEAADTLTPSNVVINMFDYWVTEGVVNDYSQGNSDTSGINENHALKFTLGIGDYNTWTGSESPYTDIVQNQLGSDGYPALNSTTTGSTESLAYLFDPDMEATGKTSYADVGGLLSVDENGYYGFDSHKRFATLDTDAGNFIEYTDPAVAAAGNSAYGQFFPFNAVQQAALDNSTADYIDHYFGLTLTSYFLQQFGGYVDNTSGTPTTFEFTGDDDIWIFIDDVLVADLGGIHDAASVVINFATGDVTINKGTDYETSTNLKTLFTTAGATDTVLWSTTQPNTFADSAEVHTLQLFYLERGNTDSNMMLKYNVSDVPSTGIFKVDQYGDPLAGATFAVYASNEDGEYLSDLNGAAVTLTNNIKYNNDWDIVDENENVLAKALYHGVTDKNGEMYFTNQYGTLYPISDLLAMFGDYFLLREVDVPDGYRTVSDDVLLKIENDLMETAESPYYTGVWSSPNALVTATSTLYVANESDSNKVGAVDGKINYYTDGVATGSLFAVVLSKGTQTGGYDTWTPISGNDADGYQYHRTDGAGTYSNVADAIEAASTYDTSHVFSPSANSMQVLLEELPGEITDYYTVLDNDETGNVENAKYLIAFYYTTADSLAGATTENTARVASHASATGEGDNGFTIQWGATIEVPNTVDALYFQKADSDGDLLDNAVFALYSAVADSDGKGYYVGTDENGADAYIRLDEDAGGDTAYGAATVYSGTVDSTTGLVTISGAGTEGSYTIQTDNITIPTTNTDGLIKNDGAGVITVTANNAAYTIAPATNANTESLVGYTHGVCDHVNEDGTGHFKYLRTGAYFLKEVKPPGGYSLSYTNVPVEVTSESVYANAGTKDNNVRVGNGVGYLVRTMDAFASLGSIDETLSWIYTHLKVEYEESRDFLSEIDEDFYTYGKHSDEYGFDGFGVANENGTTYIPKEALTDGTSLTTDPTSDDGAMVQYLEYDGAANAGGTTDDSLFDYKLCTDDDGNARGVQSYRLWTESGWSDLAIYQDYAYGIAKTSAYTEYTDLTGYGEISYLFSSSTFVQVEDKVDVDLTVTKVTTDFKMKAADGTTSTETVYLDGAAFTLQENSSGLYYSYDAEHDKTSWVSENEATRLTTETYFTYEKNGVETTEKIATAVTVTDGVVSKIYTIDDTEYSLTSYENSGEATFTAANGTTLTGALRRSFFKIYNLTEGTYTLHEAAQPTYSLTQNGTAEVRSFNAVDDMTIELASGEYWYYITTGTKNTIIVPAADITEKTTDVDGKVIPKAFKYRTEDGTVVDATVNTAVTDENGGYPFTFTYNGTETTNYLYLNDASGFTLEVGGAAATRVVKVDSTGTSAAYYDSATTAYQGGFRVMNTTEVSNATLTLVKLDATEDHTGSSSEGGYSTDGKYFFVTNEKGYSGHRVLTGAQFYLYYKTTDADEAENYYYSVDENGVVQWSTEMENADKNEVGDDGSLTFHSLDNSKTYYLVECQAPAGYSPLTEELEIQWVDADNDGAAELTVTGATSDTAYPLETTNDKEGNPSTTYLVVYNGSGVVLPATGGAGTTAFTVGGLLLMAAALVYGCTRKRKRERGAC